MRWMFGHAHPDEGQVDLAAKRRELRQQAAKRARNAWAQLAVLVPLLSGVFVTYHFRHALGDAMAVRIATVVVLVLLGWAIARGIGRALGPVLLDRLDDGTAGTIDFLIRLITLAASLVAALRIAGLKAGTLAVGGALTAVILGLAAQQTLGNLFAGVVLLTARPFRVGDRVRIKAGSIGGGSEGTVRSVGLFYTTLQSGGETAAIPNSVVVTSAIVPVRRPESVDFRAWVRPEVLPEDLQALLEDTVRTPTRGTPYIDLEEYHSDEVVMRVSATPQRPADGGRLAGEIIKAIDHAHGGRAPATAQSNPAPRSA
jgi:small conductance mechanosensitive channel